MAPPTSTPRPIVSQFIRGLPAGVAILATSLAAIFGTAYALTADMPWPDAVYAGSQQGMGALHRVGTSRERRSGRNRDPWFWLSRFGGDPVVMGRAIKVGTRDAVVVGVLPKNFRGLNLAAPVDLYMPLRSVVLVGSPKNFFSDMVISVDGRGYSPQAWITVTARLKPGVRTRCVEASLAAIANQGRPRDERDDAIVAVRASRVALPSWTRMEPCGSSRCLRPRRA